MIKKFLKKISNWLKSKLPYFIVTLLILLLILVFFYKRIVITIQSGEAGVLYMRFFGGTVTDYVYPEGVNIIAPWDHMYIYNVRIQTKFHDFEVLTNRGLPIQLSLAIRFHPAYEMLSVLHQQVGPDYILSLIHI
ncbi:SPFH domain-containing protein [Candidatus Marithrix sp. Canyon 246]|uniref:SPFH domain-containing protein n=1 Tax=Candidatus Marithrix sp. Canyon 246 TaxID=1827136 RepID=UPI00084A2B1D|nr:SPFH domain-containing protein [Candidatus Marithrix sp. Canyon 246]